MWISRRDLLETKLNTREQCALPSHMAVILSILDETSPYVISLDLQSHLWGGQTIVRILPVFTQEISEMPHCPFQVSQGFLWSWIRSNRKNSINMRLLLCPRLLKLRGIWNSANSVSWKENVLQGSPFQPTGTSNIILADFAGTDAEAKASFSLHPALPRISYSCFSTSPVWLHWFPPGVTTEGSPSSLHTTAVVGVPSSCK